MDLVVAFVRFVYLFIPKGAKGPFILKAGKSLIGFPMHLLLGFLRELDCKLIGAMVCQIQATSLKKNGNGN
jgi:hypothetical protein